MERPGHLTRAERRLDAQLSILASRQHGVVTLAQLTACGLSASAAQRRAATGRLHRVHRGVYALAPAPLLTGRGRWLAAVLACGPTAALASRSAAALHELRGTDRAGIDVIVPGRTTRRHPGIDVHRSTLLVPAVDTTVLEGIPCTTIARTLLDLAAVVAVPAVERALAQAEMLQRLDGRALTDQLERNRHHPGAAGLRTALALYEPGVAPTESPLEDLLVSVCRAAGVASPDRQVHIDPGDGDAIPRVDFAWRAQRLVLETDGAGSHRTRRSFEDDRRRDQRLTLAGWRVVRVTHRQLRTEPQRIAALLEGLLRLRPA